MSKPSPNAHGLFISAAVLALPKLTLTARLVLAEILNLHRVAGNVFARDSHFAGRLNVGVRTVGTAIAELESQDYLTRLYDPAARQKRSLLLAEKCLPILQGVVAESATSIAECLPILQGVVADLADINNTLNNNTTSLSEGAGVSAQFLASATSEQTAAPLATTASNTSSPVPDSTKGASPPAPRSSRTERKRDAAPAPVKLLPTSCPLADLLNPGGLAAKVQQLSEPLTLAQAEKLLLDYNLPALRDIFCEMANYRKLTAYDSANLTARNWLNKRPGSTIILVPPPTPPTAEEEEPDEPARLFRAEQTAKEAARRKAHLARWSANA